MMHAPDHILNVPLEQQVSKAACQCSQSSSNMDMIVCRHQCLGNAIHTTIPAFEASYAIVKQIKFRFMPLLSGAAALCDQYVCERVSDLPSFLSCTSVMISNSSSMVPRPPGKKMYAVWSDSLARTPQSTRATLREDRNLQKTAQSAGR